MKLMPFALRQRSSAMGRPSSTEGVLLSSASVKSHWFGASFAMAAGSGVLCLAWILRDGELLEEIGGGEGTAGGTLLFLKVVGEVLAVLR